MNADLIAGEPNPEVYPNLHAVMAGCVSGPSSDWPGVRAELRRLCGVFSDERNRGLRLARAAYLVGTESNGISDNEWRLKDGRVVVADFPVDSFCVAMEELEAAMEPYVVNWQALDVFADPATCSHQWQDCYPLHGEVQTYCGKCCIAGPTRLQAPK